MLTGLREEVKVDALPHLKFKTITYTFSIY